MSPSLSSQSLPQPILFLVSPQDTGPPDSITDAGYLAKHLTLSEQDVLVCVSGDGVIHQVLNGFTEREDALAALRLPIAPIPTGSGNALNVNLVGPKKATDLALAALGVIKGALNAARSSLS